MDINKTLVHLKNTQTLTCGLRAKMRPKYFSIKPVSLGHFIAMKLMQQFTTTCVFRNRQLTLKTFTSVVEIVKLFVPRKTRLI